jgi:hypothetical protein
MQPTLTLAPSPGICTAGMGYLMAPALAVSQPAPDLPKLAQLESHTVRPAGGAFSQHPAPLHSADEAAVL